MTERKVHWAPARDWTRVTACNLFIPNRPNIETTNNASKVTCLTCIKITDIKPLPTESETP